MELKDLRLLKPMSRKGSSGGPAVAIVVSVTLILVGIFLMVKLGASIPQTGFTATQSQTYNDTVSNGLTAFSLLGVGLIILGAVAILRYLFALGA